MNYLTVEEWDRICSSHEIYKEVVFTTSIRNILNILVTPPQHTISSFIDIFNNEVNKQLYSKKIMYIPMAVGEFYVYDYPKFSPPNLLEYAINTEPKRYCFRCSPTYSIPNNSVLSGFYLRRNVINTPNIMSDRYSIIYYVSSVEYLLEQRIKEYKQLEFNF